MLKKMLQNQWVVASTSISLALILVIFGLLFFNIDISDQPYILHYKAIGGIDMFGGWLQIYSLGFVALLIFIFHLFLTKIFWLRIRTLSYFLLFSTPILEIIIIIATISIIQINR
ncbi:MAG TPA: hypothetical protein PKL20_01950 [Candidatus Paceibacterota bacterium]|nr:hypothetical protein [Candidatus Paceibacterota bacterium]